MSDSRAAGAEREEEIEAICENMKAEDTFFVGNMVHGGMPSSVQPNTEYTLISRTDMGEKIWTLSGDEDYDFQLREDLVAELIRLSRRGARSREFEATRVEALEAVFGTETSVTSEYTPLYRARDGDGPEKVQEATTEEIDFRLRITISLNDNLDLNGVNFICNALHLNLSDQEKEIVWNKKRIRCMVPRGKEKLFKLAIRTPEVYKFVRNMIQTELPDTGEPQRCSARHRDACDDAARSLNSCS